MTCPPEPVFSPIYPISHLDQTVLLLYLNKVLQREPLLARLRLENGAELLDGRLKGYEGRVLNILVFSTSYSHAWNSPSPLPIRPQLVKMFHRSVSLLLISSIR